MKPKSPNTPKDADLPHGRLAHRVPEGHNGAEGNLRAGARGDAAGETAVGPMPGERRAGSGAKVSGRMPSGTRGGGHTGLGVPMPGERHGGARTGIGSPMPGGARGSTGGGVVGPMPGQRGVGTNFDVGKATGPISGRAESEGIINILPPKPAGRQGGGGGPAGPGQVAPDRPRSAATNIPAPRRGPVKTGAGSYVTMEFHGGPLVTAPELVSLYWGPFQQAEIDGMQAYLAGFAAFLRGEGAPLRDETVVYQYGMVGGTLGATCQVANAPTQANDADVHDQITTLQEQGQLPPFGPERLFLVFTKGIQFQGYGSEWCAYHNAWAVGEYYGLCPYPEAGGCGQDQPLQSWQSVTSHEILEAITDPVPGGGWTQGNEEGGDTCAWQETQVSFGTIQQFADNKLQTCSVWTVGIGKSAVVSWGPERLDVFVIGTDAALYHKYWSPSTGWGPADGFERLGGVIVGNPVAVSWAFERLDIFVVGTDLALYHKYWTPSSGWGPSANDFERLGGVIVGSPTAVSWGPERLDVFVRGTDLALYHKYWSPSTGWGPSAQEYERLGGVIVADPIAVSWAFQRLDIFVVGTDLALYHKYWSPGTGWGPSVEDYEPLGGVILGAPAAVAWAPERLDIFVVGADRGLYHKYWSPSTGWGPSATDYEPLGGVIAAPPLPAVAGQPGPSEIQPEPVSQPEQPVAASRPQRGEMPAVMVLEDSIA
jgi:hypothetical protein